MSQSDKSGQKIGISRKRRVKRSSGLNGKTKVAKLASSVIVVFKTGGNTGDNRELRRDIIRFMSERNGNHVYTDNTQSDIRLQYFRVPIKDISPADLIPSILADAKPLNYHCEAAHTSNGRIAWMGSGSGSIKRDNSRLRRLFNENKKAHERAIKLFQLYGTCRNPMESIPFLELLDVMYRDILGVPLPDNWQSSQEKITKTIGMFDDWMNDNNVHRSYIVKKITMIAERLKTCKQEERDNLRAQRQYWIDCQSRIDSVFVPEKDDNGNEIDMLPLGQRVNGEVIIPFSVPVDIKGNKTVQSGRKISGLTSKVDDERPEYTGLILKKEQLPTQRNHSLAEIYSVMNAVFHANTLRYEYNEENGKVIGLTTVG